MTSATGHPSLSLKAVKYQSWKVIYKYSGRKECPLLWGHVRGLRIAQLCPNVIHRLEKRSFNPSLNLCLSLIPWYTQGTGQAMGGFFLPSDKFVQEALKASCKWASAGPAPSACPTCHTVLIIRPETVTVILKPERWTWTLYHARVSICFANYLQN